jgi:hypothetical protein
MEVSLDLRVIGPGFFREAIKRVQTKEGASVC